jgi:hypothetical protein
MNSRLFALVHGHRHLDLFGSDDAGLFSLLARPSSWSVALATLGALPARSCPIILVAVRSAPPDSFLRALGPNLDTFVFVPGPWLRGVPRHRADLNARRAARLAIAHLRQPIHTHYLDPADVFPF